MSLRIAQEFHAERMEQIKRWGDTDGSIDSKWSPGEWCALIAHYATRQAVWELHAMDAAKFRADMVKVGALAMAAIQACEARGL